MNGTGNEQDISAKSVPGWQPKARRRSRRKYPATPEQRGLIAMCATFGADTPAGHRCSNMGQQLKSFATAAGDQRTNLAKEIRQSHDDLTRMMERRV